MLVVSRIVLVFDLFSLKMIIIIMILHIDDALNMVWHLFVSFGLSIDFNNLSVTITTISNALTTPISNNKLTTEPLCQN